MRMERTHGWGNVGRKRTTGRQAEGDAKTSRMAKGKPGASPLDDQHLIEHENYAQRRHDQFPYVADMRENRGENPGEKGWQSGIAPVAFTAHSAVGVRVRVTLRSTCRNEITT